MHLFGPTYRDLPRFMLRRVDRIAAQLNPVLMVVVLALGMLDLLVLLQGIVDGLAHSVVRAAPRTVSPP